MGIKNHKKLLKHYELLEIKSIYDESFKDSIVLVDYMTIVSKYLYSCDDNNSIMNNIKKFFNLFKASKMYIFIDEGKIIKKEPERHRREESIKKYINKLSEGIEELTEKAKSNKDDVEIVFKMEDMRLKRNKFVNFKTNKKTILNMTLDYTLSDPNKKIIYTKNEDAEFYLCRKIDMIKKKHDYDSYIYIITSDQDVLMFCIENYDDQVAIINDQEILKFKNNNITKNISRLNLVFNKSDYFNGIRSLIVRENLPCIKDYIDIDLDNSFKDIVLLVGIYVFNTYPKIDMEKYNKEFKHKIIRYISDIIKYSSLDKEFYKSENNDDIYITSKEMISYIYKRLSFKVTSNIYDVNEIILLNDLKNLKYIKPAEFKDLDNIIKTDIQFPDLFANREKIYFKVKNIYFKLNNNKVTPVLFSTIKGYKKYNVMKH